MVISCTFIVLKNYDDYIRVLFTRPQFCYMLN